MMMLLFQKTLRCVLPITLILLLVACGDDGGAVVDAGGGNSDAAPDSTRCDAPDAPLCPDNGVCFDGTCTANACLLEENFCMEGDLCDMQCVPVGDPCLTVECSDGFTCYQGSCVAGCFPPSPCLGVVCGENQFCDGGSCFDLSPCDGQCPEGEACNTFCRPISPCSDVQCANDEICVAGDCRVNPCFGIECSDGSICVNGTCLDTCDGCDCQPYEDCVFGDCVCAPSCEGKTCGEDNGCGGTCTACPTAGDVCDTGSGECSCNSSCSGRDCGELNACGTPCVANRGCQGGTCDNSDPNSPVCVCEGTDVEVCDDGDCCSAGRDCIDTNSAGGTDRCCTTGSICDENLGTDTQCCSGSQTCVTDEGCCNNNRVCADTGGNCMCNSGVAINCSNGVADDEFCCASTARACEQPDAAQACCPSGFGCYDSNDSGTLEDTCCTQAGWCGDSQVCCNVAAGEACFNDDDNDPDNDSCCAATCAGKSCGDDDGCGGRCDVESCGDGQTCLRSGPDFVCQNNECNPQCNPCSEICVGGSCESKCGDGEAIDPLTCQCGGGID